MTAPLRLDKIEKEFIRYERNGQLHSYALEIISELRTLQEENERITKSRDHYKQSNYELVESNIKYYEQIEQLREELKHANRIALSATADNERLRSELAAKVKVME